MSHTIEKIFKCKICDLNFQLKKNFEDHIEAHANNNDTVDEYKKTYVFSINFREKKTHSYSTRSKGKIPMKLNKKIPMKSRKRKRVDSHAVLQDDSATCRICYKEFSNPRKLEVHLFVHTGERPYRCKICPKGFADPSTLRKHIISHSEYRPFVCEVCYAAFKMTHHLRRHRISLHNLSEPPKKDQIKYQPLLAMDETYVPGRDIWNNF